MLTIAFRTPLTLISAFATVSAQAAQCIPSTLRLYRLSIFAHPTKRITAPNENERFLRVHVTFGVAGQARA
jgi:hypothetical protein